MHLADCDARPSVPCLDGTGNVGAAALDDAGAVRPRAQQGDLRRFVLPKPRLLCSHSIASCFGGGSGFSTNSGVVVASRRLMATRQ